MLALAGAVESTQIRTGTHDCATEPPHLEIMRSLGEFSWDVGGCEGGTARLREAGVLDVDVVDGGGASCGYVILSELFLTHVSVLFPLGKTLHG